MDLISKRVRLLFDDLGKPVSKVGVIIEADEFFIKIETDHRTEFIPKSKIIRMEVLN